MYCCSHNGDASTGCLCTAEAPVVKSPLDVCVVESQRCLNWMSVYCCSHSGDVSTGCLCSAEVTVVMSPLDACVLLKSQ